MLDQELAGGGRCNRGGKVRGAGGGIARATVPKPALRTTLAGASPFSAWNVESIPETAFDWSAALNAGDAGSHGAANLMKASGNLCACACVIAMPSATISSTAKTTLAHLRTMHRYYTRLRVRAIRRDDEEALVVAALDPAAAERLRRLPPVKSYRNLASVGEQSANKKLAPRCSHIDPLWSRSIYLRFPNDVG